jgi:hypothetical protein
VQRLHAEAQVEQKAEAAQRKGDALQIAQWTGQFLQSELQPEGDQQHDGDAGRSDGVARRAS